MKFFQQILHIAIIPILLSSILGFSKSPEKAKKPIAAYIDEIAEALIQDNFMNRDSGKKIDLSFLKSCIKEKTETYLQFYCNDLLYPYHVALLEGEYIYIVADGVSVENRALFKVSGKKIITLEDNLPKLLSYKKVVLLLNEKFPNLKMNESRLKAIAHSHYRTKVPTGGEPFVIYPGELGEENQSYAEKPIGKVAWTGNEFKLLPF
jgi:hypothetical protein